MRRVGPATKCQLTTQGSVRRSDWRDLNQRMSGQLGLPVLMAASLNRQERFSWPNTLRSVSDSMRGRSCEVVRIERGHRSPTWSTSLHIVVVPTHAGTSIYWLHESLHPQKFIAIRGGVS